MRRLGVAATVLVALVGVTILAVGSDRSRPYTVAAIFDTGKGLVGGQQVKIAGAVVGEVRRVELAPGPKARVVMDVDRRFAPFRDDATCSILPEGLISENFVECDPGSPAQAALRGPAPTVPITQTAVPTSLQDVINVFSMPVGQRVRVVLDELGVATAGRGEDLNALLRRSNPALTQSRRVLEIVASQRRQIAAAIGQTDRIMGELAKGDDAVRAFVRHSADTAQTSAAHRVALGAGVRRLPEFLRAARTGLRTLDDAMAQATPLLRDVRAGAPQLVRLTRTLPAFARAGTPALRSLTTVSGTGRRAVRAARPVGRHLQATAEQVGPFGRDLRTLLTSTRDQGGLEGALRLAYSLSTSFSAYDKVSHLVGLAISVLPQCVLDADTPGCNTKYNAPGGGIIPANNPGCDVGTGAPWDPPTTCEPNAVPATPGARRPATRRPRRPREGAPAALARPAPAAATPPVARPQAAPRPPTPAPVGEVARSVDHLLDYLLSP